MERELYKRIDSITIKKITDLKSLVHDLPEGVVLNIVVDEKGSKMPEEGELNGRK